MASRDIEKVYPTDAHSLIAIAGAAGPAIEMARIMRVELEHYEKIEGEPLELDGKANKLSQMIRANLPAAMQGMVVVPLFAGFDLRRRQGRLWKFHRCTGRRILLTVPPLLARSAAELLLPERIVHRDSR